MDDQQKINCQMIMKQPGYKQLMIKTLFKNEALNQVKHKYFEDVD